MYLNTNSGSNYQREGNNLNTLSGNVTNTINTNSAANI